MRFVVPYLRGGLIVGLWVAVELFILLIYKQE